jgi:hypothetical protein
VALCLFAVHYAQLRKCNAKLRVTIMRIYALCIFFKLHFFDYFTRNYTLICVNRRNSALWKSSFLKDVITRSYALLLGIFLIFYKGFKNGSYILEWPKFCYFWSKYKLKTKALHLEDYCGMIKKKFFFDFELKRVSTGLNT